MKATPVSRKYIIRYDGRATIKLYDRNQNKDVINCCVTNIVRLFAYDLILGQQKYLTNITDKLGF